MTLPSPDYRVRLAALGFGAMLLGWMSLEDNGALSVAILGTALALWLVYFGMLRYMPNHPLTMRRMSFMGLMIGASSAICTTALMFFKTAWHGHLFPDYPFGMMIAMVQRAPVWGIAGAMFGLALWLVLDALMNIRQLQEQN